MKKITQIKGVQKMKELKTSILRSMIELNAVKSQARTDQDQMLLLTCNTITRDLKNISQAIKSYEDQL